jgi:pimeloyl-ACP methyl ester carboxylesterase
MTQSERKGFFRKLWGMALFLRALVRGVIALLGGWIVYSRFFVSHRLELTHALGGERRTFPASGLPLSYYVSGSGKPLVLVHSINAAASAYEMKPLYEHFAASRRVFALDLPGFGFSPRHDLVYSPGLYTDAITTFLRDEVTPDHGPADVVALSLGAEFAARAASEAPELFSSLTLISPTGFDGEGDSRGNDTLLRLLSVPLWSRPLFDLLTTRRSIQLFLNRTFATRPADENLVRYAYLTAHQPGAHYAPYYFISGKLFGDDMELVYNSLSIPVMVLYGKSRFASTRRLSAYKSRSNWSLVKIERAGEMPHFEQREKVLEIVEAFLSDYALAGAARQTT